MSQIATFGTMAARAAIRDVGRVLDMSYTFCDGISKLIPNKPGTHITIADAIKAGAACWPSGWQREEEVKTLLELAQKLEGMTRNVGMHAGGVLIAPGKLTDFCPLYQQPGSDSAVSQYDKDDVEADRPGEVRLPGPGHADHPGDRQGLHRARATRARRTSRSRTSRSTTRAPTSCSPTARPRPCSSSNRAACRACCATRGRRGWKT